jgi:hypothetical protein
MSGNVAAVIGYASTMIWDVTTMFISVASVSCGAFMDNGCRLTVCPTG